MGDVCVISVGSSSGRTMSEIMMSRLDSQVKFIAADTSRKDLSTITADYKVAMGYRIVPEDGTHGDYHRGKSCAMQSVGDIVELASDCGTVVLFSNLWGGTSVGAVDEIAVALKKNGRRVIALCALPHMSTIDDIRSGANTAVDILKGKCDNTFIINTNKVYRNIYDMASSYSHMERYMGALLWTCVEALQSDGDIKNKLVEGGFSIAKWSRLEDCSSPSLVKAVEDHLEGFEFTDRSGLIVSIYSPTEMESDTLVNFRKKLESITEGRPVSINVNRSRDAAISIISTHMKERLTYSFKKKSGSGKKKGSHTVSSHNADLFSFVREGKSKSGIDWVS